MVRSHVKRAEHVQLIVDRLERDRRKYCVSWHGAGRTIPESYGDALLAGASLGEEWVLQLEDDVELAHDFWMHACSVVEGVGPEIGIISFFNPAVVVPREKLPPVGSFEKLRGAQFLFAQAFAIRAAHVEDHNATMLMLTKNRSDKTDNATGWWAASRGLWLLRAWPSLVQHGSLPSLLGHGDGQFRRAAPSFQG